MNPLHLDALYAGTLHLDGAGPADLAAAWLLTFLIHSTLLIAAAELARRVLRERAVRVQHALWRAALVGGVVTSTVFTVLSPAPLPASSAVATAATPVTTDAVVTPAAAPADEAVAPRACPEAAGAAGGGATPPTTSGFGAAGWTAWLTAGWGCCPRSACSG